MTAADDEHLIDRVLSGKLSRSSPEVTDWLAARPELARRLADLERLARGLDHTAEDERAAIAAAEGRTTGRDRQAVAQAIARARAGGARKTWPFRWVAAAAAALIVAFVLWPVLRPEEPAPVWLGTPTIRCLEPLGGVERYATFRWDVPREQASPHATFVVWVYADVDGARGAQVLSERVRDSRWEPSVDQEASLPDAIQWEVETVTASGMRSTSPAARAWRLPR